MIPTNNNNDGWPIMINTPACFAAGKNFHADASFSEVKFSLDLFVRWEGEPGRYEYIVPQPGRLTWKERETSSIIDSLRRFKY